MPTCSDCGGTVIEYDTAAGNGFCVKCGTVVEENTIVNEVTFGETSSGGAMVQGSFVAQGATHARMNGPFRSRGSMESREQTIAVATRKIQNIASVLRLSDTVCLAAIRLYTLAVEHRFTKGRKSFNVVAVCLYVACRQKETRNYMLIDFSDLLEVNVFELGHTYLQLVQTLNLRLPLVDPSHYISRFAALLEFGDETNKVATDAVRLVQRFDRDWMTRGRRPAGICGAAILLAARMNNFRRSVEEIVQVVKIADTTLKKRLEEFKNSPSSALTLADFRSVWLEEEMDPPAFTRAREQAEHDRLVADQGEQPEEEEWTESKNLEAQEQARLKKKKRKRQGSDASSTPPAPPNPPEVEAHTDSPELDSRSRTPIDPALFSQGILADNPDQEDEDPVIDPVLLAPRDSEPPPDPSIPGLSSIITDYLSSTTAVEIASQIEDHHMQVGGLPPDDDELAGLDEAELDAFLLTEEEVRIKERVWVEMNREYLEALAAKANDPSGESHRKPRKRKPQKPRDSTTAAGATPAESAHKLIKRSSKYSKRINYDAVKDLFTHDNKDVPVAFDDKDDEDDLYYMDEKADDGKSMVIIHEEGGNVADLPTAPKRRKTIDSVQEVEEDVEMEWDKDEGDLDETELDPDPGGWEDAYEQEV